MIDEWGFSLCPGCKQRLDRVMIDYECPKCKYPFGPKELEKMRKECLAWRFSNHSMAPTYGPNKREVKNDNKKSSVRSKSIEKML